MEVADKQHTSSKTMQEFHTNFTSQGNSLNTCFSRLIMGQTLQNNSSASNSHAKFAQKSQSVRAQVALFCQQPQPSSQRVGIWPHCILGTISFLWAGNIYLQPISCFFISLWPGFNNTLEVFQSLLSLIETLTFESWNLLRQGSFALSMAPCPWTTNYQ